MREPRRESEISKGASVNLKIHRLKNTISKTVKCSMYCFGVVHKTGTKHTELKDKLKYPKAYLQ